MQKGKKALGSQIFPIREEKTVQYLSALTENQQWQQSLQLYFNPRENDNKLEFHSSNNNSGS